LPSIAGVGCHFSENEAPVGAEDRRTGKAGFHGGTHGLPGERRQKRGIISLEKGPRQHFLAELDIPHQQEPAIPERRIFFTFPGKKCVDFPPLPIGEMPRPWRISELKARQVAHGYQTISPHAANEPAFERRLDRRVACMTYHRLVCGPLPDEVWREPVFLALHLSQS
jgi:hypothetical protein